jgi:hypothetical protein
MYFDNQYLMVNWNERLGNSLTVFDVLNFSYKILQPAGVA